MNPFSIPTSNYDNIPNMFQLQPVYSASIRSIYDKYLNINFSFNIIESQNKEIFEASQSYSNKVTPSSDKVPFEDFNKFNISKVESSEINNRELKNLKLSKNPVSDFEDLGVDEIEKYSYSLAKDQTGCRFLQKKLDELPNLANDIFPKVIDY